MQTVSKDGRVYCTTTVHYPTSIVKELKKAGFKVKTEAEK